MQGRKLKMEEHTIVKEADCDICMVLPNLLVFILFACRPTLSSQPPSSLVLSRDRPSSTSSMMPRPGDTPSQGLTSSEPTPSTLAWKPP
jgi:hypothetical protein